jgi:alcohol dehydrogenase
MSRVCDRALAFKIGDAVVKDCDVVLDSAGGETLVRCFECVKPGGVVVSIGSTPSAGFARSWGLNPMVVLAIRVMSRKATAAARDHHARYEYLFVCADGGQLRDTRLVESGAIKPLIDKVFPLEQVRDALAYSESGRATGKVVIKVTGLTMSGSVRDHMLSSA